MLSLTSLTRTKPYLLIPLFSLTLYLITLAPDISWQFGSSDGPELMLAATTLGIPHPPGYPTYTLLTHLFTKIPLPLSLPQHFNLFSALATTLTITLLIHIPPPTTKNQPAKPSLNLAPLLFATAPLIWAQATRTEVYPLFLLALGLTLYTLFTNRSPYLSGFLFGLTLTTHLTAALCLPLALAHIARTKWH
ncbi:MAG TPA: DUF2723 domain-containing protein, partial [Anaerolineae bacterium]|nr:DUF2723 domain-containing protein [Anaerolineae bacterium]